MNLYKVAITIPENVFSSIDFVKAENPFEAITKVTFDAILNFRNSSLVIEVTLCCEVEDIVE